MTTIAEFADRFGKYISEKAGYQAELKKICYGVECILVIFITLAFMLLFGFICGVFRETMIIFSGMLIMKYIIGGPHLSGLSRCIGLSAILTVSAAWLLKLGFLEIPAELLFLPYLAGFIIIQRYAPILTMDKASSQQHKKARQNLAKIELLILILINIFNPNSWWYGVFIGSLLAIGLVSPGGVKFIYWVETITKPKEVR